jgi:hypothetical protein
VQEEYMQFILVRAEKCPTSSGGGEFYIILHRTACSRCYKRVREGGAPKSQGVSGECVCVCDPAGALARFRRVIYLCLALCCCGGCSLFRPLGMIPACSFYCLKEV